ncbi:MAG: helix-turn-helix domain-containing protein [Lachnospiraceae bacterium]|nr:helix-turn-helix domain-containing protein [Lachnospiraceae bacterium]
MQIGEVIRKYRKDRNMTQEEMAGRLGVTAPAVNKWEKGVAQPDIMLLAPIARLLGITLETLLSFHEELTGDEIGRLVMEVDQRFERESYEEVFQYVSNRIQEYPNCHQLIWQMALILDARHITNEVENADVYEEQILRWYQRALESTDAKVQRNSANSLIQYYIRKEMYDKAEEYLHYFSEEDTERKRIQAVIYSKTNRIEEAYKAYEEILFSEGQVLNMVFHSLYMLSAQAGDMVQARKYIEKESSLSCLLEMGKYSEVSCRLESVVQEQNAEETLLLVKQIRDSIPTIGGFANSWLYAHMEFKEISETFEKRLRNNLLKCFSDRETFGYMDGNAEWEELICQD